MKDLKFRFLLFSCVFIAAISTITGCGQGYYMVTGTVTLDGEPLGEASVMFSPTEEGKGDMASGYSKPDGSYAIHTTTGKPGRGTTEGTYVVTFKKLEERWDGKSYYVPDLHTGEKVKDIRMFETLPEIYTNPNKSQIKVTVGPKQKNVFDFDLKTKP